jgi:hypothetical protein
VIVISCSIVNLVKRFFKKIKRYQAIATSYDTLNLIGKRRSGGSAT